MSPCSDVNIFAQPQHAQPPHRIANEHQRTILAVSHNVFPHQPTFQLRKWSDPGPMQSAMTAARETNFLTHSSARMNAVTSSRCLPLPCPPRQAVQVEHGHRLQTVEPSAKTPEPCWDRLLPTVSFCQAPAWLAGCHSRRCRGRDNRV